MIPSLAENPKISTGSTTTMLRQGEEEATDKYCNLQEWRAMPPDKRKAVIAEGKCPQGSATG